MNFLENSPLNATYISFKTYNHLIHLLAKNIQDSIVANVKRCKVYGIMFDETSDVSSNSMLSIVIRYFDDNNKIREDFLGFFSIFEMAKKLYNMDEPKITGEVLGNLVKYIIESFGLRLENCISIGTDGASMLVSKRVGAVQKIKESSPQATHSYCLSHLINLSINALSKNPRASLVISTIKKCHNFFKYFLLKFVYFKWFTYSFTR